MKKTFVLFIAIAYTSITSAQVSLRPQAGFNSSNLTKDLESAEFSDQLGFQFGIDLQLGNKVYLQPGIFWESSKNELKERIDDRTSEFTISRVRVPVMLGYRLISDEAGAIDARLFTGPNASFAVSKNLDETALLSKDDFKGAIYGWNIGFGVDLAIVFIDAGYSFGLSEVFEGVSSSARNNLFYVNAGLRLGW